MEKKLDSLKRRVRTTSVKSAQLKQQKIKKVVLLIITLSKCQCAALLLNNTTFLFLLF